MTCVQLPAAPRPFTEWQALLAPLPGPDPCGESLLYEGTFDRVRRARHSDDETLAQGVWETTPKKADWTEAAAICSVALETSSKDLQLAAWLLESWTHLHGFAGAAAGMNLLRGLCERFGSSLHPRAEDQDPQFRYSAIRWINDKLPTDLKLVVLTAPTVGPATWADWEGAQRLVQTAAKDRELEPAAAAARADFHKRILDTPASWLGGLRGDLRSLTEASRELDRVIEVQSGPEAPSLSGVRRVTEFIEGFLDSVLAKREPPLAAPPPVSPLTSDTAGPVLERPSVAGAVGIRTREEAYRMLSEASAFLQLTEPHSPVPYLVERAIAWGGMSLAELLPELIRDRDNLSEIHRLLRIGSASGAGPAFG